VSSISQIQKEKKDRKTRRKRGKEKLDCTKKTEIVFNQLKIHTNNNQRQIEAN